jgi:hypothetical protein
MNTKGCRAWIALVAVVVAACGDSGKTPPAPLRVDPARIFDVNDLSFLLPLGPDGLPYPEIKVTDRNGLDPATGATQGQIWPAHLFSQVTTMAVGKVGTATPGNTIHLSPGEAAFDNWRVVGVRFLPCALSRKTATGSLAGLPANFPGCVTQVRLVAQPFVDGVAEDVSVHLVFSIAITPPAAAFAEFAKKLNPPAPGPGGPSVFQQAAHLLGEIKKASLALGADTNGLPVQPHPGLAKELALGERPAPGPGALLKTFVQAFTQPRAMTQISYMGVVKPGFEPWIFFGGDVEPGSLARPLPPAPFDEATLHFVPKGGRPTDAQGTPQESTPAILLRIVGGAEILPAPADQSTDPLFKPRPSRQEKAALFTLDNPGIKHNFNVDCVTCHTTGTRAIFLNERSRPGDDRLPSPPGISGFIRPENVPRNEWNLRNFGIFTSDSQKIFKQPTVSSRTLAEIIDATQLTNDILAGKESGGTTQEAAGPGLVCADEIAVWNCTMIDGGQDCFKSCTLAGGGAK